MTRTTSGGPQVTPIWYRRDGGLTCHPPVADHPRRFVLVMRLEYVSCQ